MRQPKVLLDEGIVVKIQDNINKDRLPGGFYIPDEFRNRRQPGMVGHIMGELPQSEGAVYWVKHADKTVSAYSVGELDLYGPKAEAIADYYNISSW